MNLPRSVSTCCFVVLALLVAVSATAQGSNPKPLTTEDTRLTTGVESAGGSSQQRQNHMLIDFMLTAPLGDDVKMDVKPRFGAWLNARFNGTTTGSIAGVRQFVGGFEDKLVAGGTDSLLNTLTFKGGAEVSLANGFDFGGHYQLEPLLIGALGFTTPPPVEKPAIFDVSEDARARWDIPLKRGDTDVKYVGFVEPERSRFYSQWEVGLRLKSHHFSDGDDNLDAGDTRVNFPGIIDFTFGQNAAITGGIRRGYAIGVEALYPLPTDNIANAIYLFGSSKLQRVRDLDAAIETPPVILSAATATVAVPSAELWLETLSPEERTRDEWSFGVGVDLIRLFAAATNARAADVAERGFSKRDYFDIDEVKVTEVRMQPGESGVLVHGTDIIIPLRTATLQNTTTGGGMESLTFTANTPQVATSVRRQLKATGEFSMLLVRLKPGTPKSAALGTFGSLAAATEKTELAGDRYSVARITCAAACSLTPGASENLLLVLPVSGAGVKVTGTKPATWTIGEPVRVDRGDAFTIAAPATGAEMLIVRIR